MAQRLIVGIYPDETTDPKALEGVLASQSIDASRVKVVTRSAPSQEHQDETPIDFVAVAEEMESNSFADDLTHGTGILSDSGGTSVPGIGGAPTARGLIDAGGGSRNYLGAFAIDDDEVDNYNDAIEDGRAVVIVQAGDDEAVKLAASFKAAGLKNVRTF